MNPSQPRFASRPGVIVWTARACAFMGRRVPLADVGMAATAGLARIEDGLRRRGVVPARALFLRCRRIDMSGPLDIETGVPVEGADVAEAGISFGRIPAGRDARLLWCGPCDGLVAGHAELLAWGRREGIACSTAPGADGDRFGARLQTCLVGPAQEADPRHGSPRSHLLIDRATLVRRTPSGEPLEVAMP